MERWKGKVALVTGASSGIGYDLSKRLCELGMNVVGCARNIEKIQTLAAELKGDGYGRLVAVKCDVKKEEEIKATFEVAKKEFGGVDVCVGNAGLAHNSPLLSGNTEEWRDMMEVNVLGLCICNREFMTQLKERGVDEGHIFLLNSMSGHRIAQTLSTVNAHFYAVTKFAVTAMTEGVRQELRAMKSKVRVTSISPGFVRTEFAARMQKADDVKAVQKGMGDVMETEDISSAIVYTLSTPPRMEINDILIRPTIQVL